MNALRTFLGPTYDDILAGLRMKLAPVIVDQPRDDATGRFVSKRDLVRRELEASCSRLTNAQRKAAIARATDKQKAGRGA